MKKILDHGYITAIESWGSDQRIVEAARMSTDKGFLGWGTPDAQGDEKLLGYLWRNEHKTPFEMAGLVIEVQAPILVFREWVRHRSQSFNELSARYTQLPDLQYLPTVERLMVNANGSNKQANRIPGAPELSIGDAEDWLEDVERHYRDTSALYQRGLDIGVPKEIARIIVPVGQYSRMRASANLRNWLAFVTLRSALGAQWEIRQYANAVADILAEKFPRTMEIFSRGM